MGGFSEKCDSLMPWFLQPFNKWPSWSFLWLLLNYGSKIYRFNFYAVILISCSVSSTRRKLRTIIIWVFYKSCRFCIVEIYHLTLEVILHKNDYVIQHFNKIFLLYIFANNLLLVVYFMFILYFRAMLDRKEIWASFIFWVHINKGNSQCDQGIWSGATNKHPMQWWLKKFCRRDKCLEDEEMVLVIGNWQWPTEKDHHTDIRATLKVA